MCMSGTGSYVNNLIISSAFCPVGLPQILLQVGDLFHHLLNASTIHNHAHLNILNPYLYIATGYTYIVH